MRYVVFGDIHGNLEALEAVLGAMEKDKPDHYIDVCADNGTDYSPLARLKMFL